MKHSHEAQLREALGRLDVRMGAGKKELGWEEYSRGVLRPG